MKRQNKKEKGPIFKGADRKKLDDIETKIAVIKCRDAV